MNIQNGAEVGLRSPKISTKADANIDPGGKIRMSSDFSNPLKTP